MVVAAGSGVGGLVLFLVGCAGMAAAWFLDRRRRSYTDTPTTPAAAVFSGRNEVAGVLRSADALVSHRSRTETVWWRYTEEEERTHTRQVSSTDSEGRTTSRTETYQEWHTITSLAEARETFQVADATGVVQVRLEGASIVPVTLVSTVEKREREGGFVASLLSNTTGRYRHTEEGLPVGVEIFVVGEASLRDDIVAPEIGKGPGTFLVSTRSEASHTSRLAWAVPILALLCGAAMTFGAGLVPEPGRIDPVFAAAGLAVWALLLLVGWTVVTYNRLRLVAGAAHRAWSLIEVQLARRRDLIPGLVAIAKGASAHEAATQASVAAERRFTHLSVSEAEATAGEQTLALRTMVARLEDNPALAANGAYLNLMDQLRDTEMRIGAARSFYNDSVTITRDRGGQFPGLLIARRMELPAPQLFAAEGLDLRIRI